MSDAAVTAHPSLLPCHMRYRITATSIRHGERGPLVKDPYTNEDFIGPIVALTEDGERMCYNAGVTLRQRYIDTASPYAIPEVATFSLSNILVRVCPSRTLPVWSMLVLA